MRQYNVYIYVYNGNVPLYDSITPRFIFLLVYCDIKHDTHYEHCVVRRLHMKLCIVETRAHFQVEHIADL